MNEVTGHAGACPRPRLESPIGAITPDGLPATRSDSSLPASWSLGDRAAWGVVTGWAAQLVIVIGGFISPRMIDQHLGPTLLGVWDFGWALVSYLGLVQGGVVSSISRFVAQSGASDDINGINRVMSSVAAILATMALVILALTFAAMAFLLPIFFTGESTGLVSQARTLVLLLGTLLSVQVCCAAFGGLLTGLQRWDLNNAVNSSVSLAGTIGLVAVLEVGGGLGAIAGVFVVTGVVGEMVRARLAYRVFPELGLSARDVDRATIRRLIGFGGKSFAPQVGELLMNQASILVVMAALGPVSVALFARSRSLVRNVRVFVLRYSFVMTPLASELHALSKKRELQQQLIESTRIGLFITLPMILGLTILGSPLLRVWMGRAYDSPWLLAILAVGYLPGMAMQPAFQILSGMNAHGRPGVVNLAAALLSVALSALAMGPLHWGLERFALILTLPLAFSNGLYLPAVACRRLDLPQRRFWLESTRAPVLCALPIALWLLAARSFFTDAPWAAVGSGLAGSAILAGPLYWRYALGQRSRQRLVQGWKWSIAQLLG